MPRNRREVWDLNYVTVIMSATLSVRARRFSSRLTHRRLRQALAHFAGSDFPIGRVRGASRSSLGDGFATLDASDRQHTIAGYEEARAPLFRTVS
jgi:Rad3-related DNA helicase